MRRKKRIEILIVGRLSVVSWLNFDGWVGRDCIPG